MKIYFDNVNFESTSGPNTFARRLAQSLYEKNCVICDPQDKCDITLSFIEVQNHKKESKLIQRLDGIWFKPQDFSQNKNQKIQLTYNKADCVIYQSQFDKSMAQKWLGVKENHFVIGNGININPVKEENLIPEISEIRDKFSKIFICSANWHPQKRLKANIELFNHLRQIDEPNSCLIVMGSNPDYIPSSRNIFYTGTQDQEICLQAFAISDWMLHLAFLDHTPNVVIEAISQGTPVICSETGGTKEIIQNFGLILKDFDYQFEPFDYDKPPEIDITQIKSLPEKNKLGFIPDVSITKIADQYINTFKSVLSSN